MKLQLLATALVALTPAALPALDLTNATIVAPPGWKAVTVLVEEVEKRTQLRWPVAQQQPASSGPAVVIRNLGRGPAEGSSIAMDASGVRVDGNDARSTKPELSQALQRWAHQSRNAA